MSQPPQSSRSASPLTARLYDLEYPRSLGVYSTYQEVQSVVDTLADRHFPVQSTLIVGTDLKLMERVTGRKTWPRVLFQGVLSGLSMGMFMGLLLWFLNPENLMIIIPSIVLGIIFFTVWAGIGYAMTGGRRDFTSMTATIPMQYELLVEHKHAQQARQILAESGAAPAPARGPEHGWSGADAPAPTAPGRAGRPSFGRPAGAQLHEGGSGPSRPHGARSFGAPAPSGPPSPRSPHEGSGPDGSGEGGQDRPSQAPRPGDGPGA